MTRLRHTAEERGHLAFIRSLPCAVCARCIDVEAAHVRYADAAWKKPLTGAGTKPDPWWVVPLCRECHAEQHLNGNERGWWWSRGFDPDAPGLSPLALCLDLWGASELKDIDLAREVISQHRFNIACGLTERAIPEPPTIEPRKKRRRGPGPKGRGFQKPKFVRAVDGCMKEKA